MAKKAKGLYAKIEHEPIFHKTSIGRRPSLQKMNKKLLKMLIILVYIKWIRY